MSGCNINEAEGCGITPLILGIVNKDIEIVKLLLENHASVEKRMFFSIPDPVTIAEKVGDQGILELLNKYSVDTDIEDQKVKS